DGVFSASPTGLSLNASSGAINPSLSQPGIYTVTYTPSGTACGTSSAEVEILAGGGGPVTCDPEGNWLLISNYDGGNLNVIVDEDIPNLKIGICTYEPVNVTFSGPFVSSITDVHYAGFNSAVNNNHCGFPISASTFAGINPALVEVEVYPPVNIISPPNPNNFLNQPNGWNDGLICLYSCDLNSYQGGCNTADQVLDYFQTQFGGSLRGLAVQYCCWSSETPYRVSNISGNCCNSTSTGVATVTYPSGPFCVGDANVSPTITGDNSGTFYSVPTGLNVDAATGLVDFASSVPGTYQIVYANQVNCSEILINNTLTLNAGTSQPPAFAFSNPLCAADITAEVQPLAGFAPGGTFSASPSGLSIDAESGTINLNTSQPNQYAISYTLAASSCGTAQTFTFPNLVIEPVQEPYPLVLGDTCLSVPLTVQLGGTLGVQSIQWNMGDPNGGSSNLSNSPNHTHQYSQAGTFTITAIVEYGCGTDTITRVIETVESEIPQLSFAYPIDPCRMSNTAPVLASGFATGGIFSVSPALPINNANGTLGALGNTEGEFVITYTYSGGNCIAAGAFSDTISVEAFSESLVAQPESVTLVLGDTVELGASGTLNYNWTPDEGLSCSNCPSPLAYPAQTTQYIVSGIDANGCRSSDTVLVFVDIICNEVFIPSIFSPNGKGPQSNENFCVFSDCVAQFKLVILNRWGQQVFETEDINQCWDGTFKETEAPSGVYAYNVYIRQLDGTVLSKTGSLILVK
ncbi:MAG: gliding motility-associated C-terminal domain-containing protein, partial [Bacteroidia bacterium]